MIVKKKAVAPTVDKTSTAKKLAAARVTEDAITATDVKRAIAAPKAEKPVVKKNVPVEEKATEKAAEKTVKKTAAKKTTAKKTAAKKTTASKTAKTTKAAPAKKTTAKKETEQKFVVQFNGHDVTKEEMENRMLQIWTEDWQKKQTEMKKVAFYVKTEEAKVYFVVTDKKNNEITGSFDI